MTEETTLKSMVDAEIEIIKEYCKSWGLRYTDCVEDSIRILYEYLAKQDITVVDDNIEIYDDFCVYEVAIYDDNPSEVLYSMDPQIEEKYKFESESLNNCIWKAVLFFHKQINESK